MFLFFFFLMIRRPPRSTLSSSSAASDVYKRQQSTPPRRCVASTRATTASRRWARARVLHAMPDRERRRWADSAPAGLGLTGQTAAAGTTVTELAAGWGTGQSAVRRHRRWRRPGPAGSTAARPRLDGPSSPLPGQPCPQLLDLGAVLRLGGRLLDPLGQLSALRAAGELGELLGQ